jgi:hypothetical protein
MKRFFTVLLLLLPCFALVSCKSAQIYKTDVRAYEPAVERKIIGSGVFTGAGIFAKANDGPWVFSITIDCPSGDGVAEATITSKEKSFASAISHEADKYVVSWEAPKKRFVDTAHSFDVVLSFDDGSQMAIAFKHHRTAYAHTGDALVGLLGTLL